MEVIQERLNQQEKKIVNLEDCYKKDHEETMKQGFQIDTLFQKLGNGWSGKVVEGIESTDKRVTKLENKVDIIGTKLDDLTKRPRNRMLLMKDVMYMVVAGITILTVLGIIK